MTINSANLILTFNNEHPCGYIAGARTNYDEEITGTVSRGLAELQAGDRLDLFCDHYSYDGEFLDDHYLGDPMIEDDEITSPTPRSVMAPRWLPTVSPISTTGNTGLRR